MKITHVENKKLEVDEVTKKKHIFKLEDLPNLTRIVKEYYSPNRLNASELAYLLSEVYENLELVPVKVMIYSGGLHQNTHNVCKVTDTNLLLDPAGDYLNQTNLMDLRREIVPWIYCTSKLSPTTYLSQDHMPFVFIDAYKFDLFDIDNEQPSEEDIVRLSSSFLFDKLRAIIL